MLVLSEFLDENSHRSYPFKYHNNLPTNFLLDAHFLVTGNIDKDGLYITAVSVMSNFMTIEAAAMIDGRLNKLGTIFSGSISSTEYRTHTLSYKSSELEVLIDGSITTGMVTEDQRGYYDINENEGQIFEGCVTSVTNWCTGVVINGKLYTGLVEFQFDDSITIEEEGDTIKIGIANYIEDKDSAGSGVYVNLQEELENLLKEKPITSINGIKPDSSGNFTIAVRPPVAAARDMSNLTLIHAADDSDKAFPLINTISLATGEATIYIQDLVTKPCFDVNKSLSVRNQFLDKLFTNYDRLAERAATIEQAVTALERDMNILNAQLTKV